MIDVLVHFGPPKTGSSSIQQWLVTHSELLLNEGIYYPKHNLDENGVSSGNVRALFDFAGDDMTFNTTKLAKLLQQAQSRGAKLLLLSSEFFMRQIEVIAREIPQAKFIGFVRFPLDNIESNYNQGVKRKFTTDEFKTSLTPRAPIFDIVENAVAAVGAEKFTLLPFERTFFENGDLVATFLAQLGITNGTSTDTIVNTSYTFEALEVKRWFNQFNIKKIQQPLDSFLQGCTRGTTKFSLVAPEDYQKVKQHYLARTKQFLSVVNCLHAEAYFNVLENCQQKPFKSQGLTDDVFERVMRDWLKQRSIARFAIEQFLQSVNQVEAVNKSKLQILERLCAEYEKSASSFPTFFNGGLSLKEVRNAMSLSKLKSFRKSGINQLSWRSAIDKWRYETNGSALPVHENVEWISHHIPKTAGSSLRKSLDKAYGEAAIYGVYRHSGANEISRGENIWIPKETKVIHGHFATHANQKVYFPNAKRIAWVRDPLERAWSLLGRLLDIKEKDPLYSQLKSKFIDKGITDKAELFACWLQDNDLKRPLNDYKRYFRAVDIAEFDFIGSMHSMDKDMARLSEILGINLDMEQRNIRAAAKDLPEKVRQLAPLFESEYDIVGNYLHKDG